MGKDNPKKPKAGPLDSFVVKTPKEKDRSTTNFFWNRISPPWSKSVSTEGSSGTSSAKIKSKSRKNSSPAVKRSGSVSSLKRLRSPTADESDSKKGKTGCDNLSILEGAVGGNDSSAMLNDTADVISIVHSSPIRTSQDIVNSLG